MIKFFKATYAINAAQISNMAISAFAVPLVIGVAQYGKFAAVFAAPAFAQSMLETFATVRLATHHSRERFWLPFIQLGSASVAMVFLINSVLFDIRVAALSAALGLALIFRGAVSAYIYTNKSGKVIITIVSAEIITIFVYIAVLVFACIISMKSYVIPIVMLVVAALLSGVVMIVIQIKVSERNGVNGSRESGVTASPSLRLLLSRLYEDSVLTLMPLILARTFGLTLAGEFRVLVSIIKALSKTFPFRYEILLRSVMTQEFRFSVFLRVALVFSVLGIPLYFAVVNQEFFSLKNPSLSYVTLTAGMMVTSLAAFPAAIAFSAGLSITSLVLSIVLFSSTVLIQSVPFFVGLYSIMNVVVYFYTLSVLSSGTSDLRSAG